MEAEQRWDRPTMVAPSTGSCGEPVDANHLNMIRQIDPMADVRHTYGFIKAIITLAL
jgi:hypothetical protein